LSKKKKKAMQRSSDDNEYIPTVGSHDEPDDTKLDTNDRPITVHVANCDVDQSLHTSNQSNVWSMTNMDMTNITHQINDHNIHNA
jgi:hypothetical protein